MTFHSTRGRALPDARAYACWLTLERVEMDQVPRTSGYEFRVGNGGQGEASCLVRVKSIRLSSDLFGLLPFPPNPLFPLLRSPDRQMAGLLPDCVEMSVLLVE